MPRKKKQSSEVAVREIRRLQLWGDTAMEKVLAIAILMAMALPLPLSAVAGRSHQALPQGDRLNEYLAAGLEALEAGKYKRAVRSFSKAEELTDGSSMPASQGLATAHLSLGQLRQARLCADRARQLAATSEEQASSDNLIGTILYEEWRRTNPKTSKATVLLADAEAHFERAVDLSRGHLAAAWLNLSIVQREQGHVGKAIQTAEEYLDREPEDRTASTHLCWLHYLASTSEEGDSGGVEESPGQLEAADPRKIRRLTGPDGEDIVPPRPLVKPSPVYTPAAREKRVEGVVIIEATINERGFVEGVRVLKGLPLGQTEKTVRTACQMQFEPATLNGVPIAVYYHLTSKFRLTGRK